MMRIKQSEHVRMAAYLSLSDENVTYNVEMLAEITRPEEVAS